MASKNKTLIILKYGAYGLLIVLFAALVNYVLGIIFSVYFIPEEAYATNFYGYYNKEAHKSMFSQVFKYFADYKYDPNEDNGKVGDWIKEAQGTEDEEGILFDGYPEHFPRGPKYYYSLNFDWNENVFLKLRKELVENDGKPLDEDIKSGKKNLSDKDANYWTKSANDVIDKAINNPRFGNVIRLVGILFNDLLKEEGSFEEDDKMGSTFNPESKIIQQIQKILNETKEDDDKEEITDKDIYNALKSTGEIAAVPMVRFIYSRIVYSIYFLSLGIEDKETLAYKDKKASREALFRIANGVSYILSKVYKYPINHKQENGGIWAKVRDYYAPKAEFNEEEAKKNVDEVMKILNKYQNQETEAQ